MLLGSHCWERCTGLVLSISALHPALLLKSLAHHDELSDKRTLNEMTKKDNLDADKIRTDFRKETCHRPIVFTIEMPQTNCLHNRDATDRLSSQ